MSLFRAQLNLFHFIYQFLNYFVNGPILADKKIMCFIKKRWPVALLLINWWRFRNNENAAITYACGGNSMSATCECAAKTPTNGMTLFQENICAGFSILVLGSVNNWIVQTYEKL